MSDFINADEIAGYEVVDVEPGMGEVLPAEKVIHCQHTPQFLTEEQIAAIQNESPQK